MEGCVAVAVDVGDERLEGCKVVKDQEQSLMVISEEGTTRGEDGSL